MNLNQGTIYPALVRIEQRGWTRDSWGQDGKQSRSEVLHHPRAGLKALNKETERWRQMVGVVEKLLAEEQ